MKKLIVLILVASLSLISSIAIADVDVSTLSYDELLVLQKKLTTEIMSRPEWKEVVVPAGIWTIGEDIPAGTYSLTCADEYGASFKAYPDSTMSDYDFVAISGNSPLGKYTFTEGMVIDLNRAVIFAPPVLLGF